MEKQSKPKFQPNVCAHCEQTTDYALALDKGTAMIVLAVYNAVRLKNENRIHLTNEMECRASDYASYREMVQAGKMTSNMTDNVLRAKYHGLLAQVEGGGRGEYLITPKGARFLRNESLPRVAIVDKATHTKKAYWNEDEDRVSFSALMRKETPWWNLDENDLTHLFGERGVNDTAPLGI